MKTCTVCKEEKELENFYKHKSGKQGRKAVCKSCENIYDKERYNRLKLTGLKYIKNKQSSVRNSNYKSSFGITTEQYDELLEKQDYCCAVCLKHETEFKIRLAVDHAKVESKFVPEGAIRGLLCNDCNLKLISNIVDPDIFERAARYVKQFTGLVVPRKE